ncbi:DUF2971 domain-containing protein [Francisella hispaniensis]|nr:DUF2971 domain-containing protein [Francisella hispaniensis]
MSSFSTNSDDLSQWRAYGRNGEGVCFKLKNFGLKQFIHLYKVIYKPADKYKIIHHILYKYSYWFHKEKTDYYYNDYVESLIRHFSQLFPIFKDEAFESENEIRLVFDRDYYPSYDKVIKKHYRVSNNFLLPYIETSDLSFDDIKKPMIDIEILKVILGPTTKHKELTKQSIEDFLQEKGFSDTKVEFSKLPYR